MEEFVNALGTGVGLEAGEQVLDEADAAGRAGAGSGGLDRLIPCG